MPRANRRRDEGAPLDLSRVGGGTTTQTRGGRAWTVRQLTGATSDRIYRCPGCRQEIVPGTPHVVVWPADGALGLDERRHWHSRCWQRDGGKVAG